MADDPLAQLEVETQDFVGPTEELLALADRHAKGRLVSVAGRRLRPRRPAQFFDRHACLRPHAASEPAISRDRPG